MSTPLDTVKAFYGALAKGDAPAALGLLAPDMEWSVVDGWPYKPMGRGPQRVADGVLMPVLKEWRDYALATNDMLVCGETIVSMGRMTGVHTVTGKPLDAAYVHVWDVRDGRIVRMRQTVDTAVVVAART
jgi:hypothetical protein